jgi:hypothetical protein
MQIQSSQPMWCLTNLEAAISFLENVDLSTLRADELQDGPLKPPNVEEAGSLISGFDNSGDADTVVTADVVVSLGGRKAISFLENVDLSTLRADELQDGPLKPPSETTTPSAEL